ncbi:MAG: hypothetical protein OEZ35_01090 [Candidatus Bathyarchaeota archaeon]|nr:hypothetical protein [Candidatus Bathyarchaeota archaeon]
MRFIPESFFDGMEYLGEFESVRQIYYIYRKNDDYLLVTLSRNRLDSFNVNFIPKKCVEYVTSNFSREIVDRKDIEKRKTSIFGNSREKAFKILNTLYVLCVLGRAKRINESEHGTMKFRVAEKEPRLGRCISKRNR